MDPNTRAKEALFTDALALPSAERASFLAKACGTDAALHAELVDLLAAHEGPENLTSPVNPTQTALAPEEKPGDWIGRYRLLQKIGEGGCGVVWMAEQEEPVRRRVALKVIKLGMDTKAVIARFEAERQALAMMDHSHIAKVHDAGSTATGRPYFVMELVRGIPITKYCDEQQLSPAARLELFIKVCHAVQHAHQKGVIHRDLKPSNILVTVNDGQATPKVIDFGIAKATQGRLTDATLFTAFEQFIGTPAYMSPEQAEMSSLDIDTRSDIYSLGVLLYELLTGRPPFDPKRFAHAGVEQIRQQIREDEPPRPSARWRTLAAEEQTTVARLRGTLPAQISGLLRGDLDWIVMRCLEKDRARRYDTANGLAMDLQRHLRHEPVVARPPSTAYLLQKLIRRHRFGFAAAGFVLAAIVLGALATATQATRALRAERLQNELREAARQAQVNEIAARRSAEDEQLRNTRQRLFQQHVLPEINRLFYAGDIAGAFAKALKVEKDLPDDPALTALWPRISQLVSIETSPAGADVYLKPYRKPDVEWQFIGKSPLQDVRLAKDAYRWQIKMDGYAPLERAGLLSAKNQFSLDPAAVSPPGMVCVEGGPAGSQAPGRHNRLSAPNKDQSVRLESYFIDRYEVTHRQFKDFVDRGGYATVGFWKQPFIKEGRELTWAQAIAEFRDATGRPGPASWRNGTYPEGEDEHPVTGISWFEAAAFAESVGKRLPSIYHWFRAAAASDGPSANLLVSLSNFAGRGAAHVGIFQGMSKWGAYDMAGNAKEWCWNEAEPEKRYILGGGSDDPAYQFTMPDAQSPFNRSPANGFRCVKLIAATELALGVDGPVVPVVRDYSKEQPVRDEIFRVYQNLFAYDKTDLNARIETVDNSHAQWRKERISFNTAYGYERMPVYLFLPKKVSPPYQAVIFFPGANTLNQGSSERLEGPFGGIVPSGRALVCPVFKGTYERREGWGLEDYLGSMNLYRDTVIQWSKDLGRTIDYLETRKDIQSDRIAYEGFSWGAQLGAVLPALEHRFKAVVLVSGGMSTRAVPPEVDQINFAPRITIPTLMLNGRYDFTYILPSQQQLFRLLGAPPKDKRHLLFDAGHISGGEEWSKEVLAWLDRYLGPAK